MGTSLTPDWKLFAVLLVISAAITFVVSAVADALVVRLQQRRRLPRPPAGLRGGTSQEASQPRRTLTHH
ncbi:hypothetical protein ACIQAC_06435 [Streptomyces sp. NPDC088387]|uniref:hypothetical protein n=1 Tax=Streptomyces sp. NPDC088387 TaxID=3365859 RepID=UPI00382FA2AD